MYRASPSFLLSALAATYILSAPIVNAQSTFEPGDFNITDSLLDFGINIDAIPILADFVADELAAASVDDSAADLRKRDTATACDAACSSLSTIYGQDAIIRQGAQQATYDAFTANYWSNIQAEVNPYCIFKPSTQSAVSVLVLISRLTECPFAVKSGGHAAFAGGSNIAGGITVSLQNLNSITVATDKKTVAIQPGNTWLQIYTTLAKSDLIVVGGRVADIGIGGLTLGGGISFFSNVYGWACDNVASYEVVTASGIPIVATPTKYADIYWALRGGGNNFGIVTKFTLYAYPLPGQLMWGGSRVSLEPQFPALIDAFSNWAINSEQDTNAGQWLVFLNNGGSRVATYDLWYAKPNGQESPLFAPYKTIPYVYDTTKDRTLWDYTTASINDNPYGRRQSFYSLNVKLTPEIATQFKDIFFDSMSSIQGVPGFSPILILQAITKPQISHMSKNGGNALGLGPDEGPLLLALIDVSWANAGDDQAMYAYSSDLMNKFKAAAAARGLTNDFVYMNYAAQFQDVVGSYGATNKARLISVAQKYDPKGVFETLQPGHFKLEGPPVKGSGFFSY